MISSKLIAYSLLRIPVPLLIAYKYNAKGYKQGRKQLICIRTK